ncbi:MAG: PAS domain-containing protein, partial [Alphaproteobacteria bacterium]
MAASILCALGIIVLASWRMLENEHARHLREESAFAAAEVEARLQSKFDALLMALMTLGSEVRGGESDPLDHALEHFAGAARNARGIADIAWVEPSGATRSIALDAAVTPGPIGDVLRHPAAAEALRSAAEAGAPRVSAPIVLVDDDPVIVTVLPLARVEGSLALVLRAAPFIEDVLRHGLRRSFDVCVHDGTVPLYAGGQGPCTLSWVGAGEVRLADRVWHIAVAPPPARAAASVPDLENKMSAVGMAALALLAAFLWLLLSRRSTLREAEQRVSDIAANFPGDIYRRVLHPDGSISFPYASAGGGDVYGRVPESIVADSQVFLDMIHPDDRAGWHEAVRLSAARLERFDHQYRIVPSSGEARWVHSIAQPRRAENGDVVWDGVMVDITAHRNAEEALKESEQRLASIATNIPGVVFRRVLHADGRISYPYDSARGQELWGSSGSDLAADGQLLVDAIHPDDRAGWHEALHASAGMLAPFD